MVLVHILSPVTDKCCSCISRRRRMTIEMICDQSLCKLCGRAGIQTCDTWICSQMSHQLSCEEKKQHYLSQHCYFVFFQLQRLTTAKKIPDSDRRLASSPVNMMGVLSSYAWNGYKNNYYWQLVLWHWTLSMQRALLLQILIKSQELFTRGYV